MLRKVQIVFVIFVIILSVLSTFCNGEVIKLKSGWVKPDAFSRRKPKSPSIEQTITSSPNSDSCPVCPELKLDPQTCLKPEDDIATALYKRLVSSLIIKNEVPSKSSTRILKLTVSEKHLKILESSDNIRDWDGVMSEIISSIERVDPETNFVYKPTGFGNVNFSSATAFLSRSEVQFALFVILFLSVVVYLKKKFKWGIIWILAVALFSSGYFYTYYECNRQLEVDDLVNMMHSQQNPCEEMEKPQPFLNSLLRIFSNPKKECENYLRKKHQIKLTFCRPDDVWIKFLNNLMFDQLEVFVKKSVDIFQKCAREIPFPYNIVAMLALPFFLIAIIKLVFQYMLSPSAWFQMYRVHRETALPQNSRVEMISGGISQENFHKVLETIKAVSSVNAIQSVPQGMSNMIIAPPQDTSNMITAPPQDTSNMITAQPPVPMKRKLSSQLSGVELLDDPDPVGEDSGTASNESGLSNESCDKIKAA